MTAPNPNHETATTSDDKPRRLIDYVELHCHSAFSLLDGASTPEALVTRAHTLGYRALAITDHNDLGGVVRFAGACEFNTMGGIIGSELTVDVPANVRELHNTEQTTRTHLTVLAETREGYHNLSQLITHARMNTSRGEPAVPWSLLTERANGLTVLTGCPRGWIPRLINAGNLDDAYMAAGIMRDVFGEHLAIECWDHRLHEERVIVRELQPLAKKLGVACAVTNNVHYATADQRLIHDVLCALRHNLTLDEMGTRLRPNAEWAIKDEGLIYKRWSGAEEGVRETVAIAERCTFRLAHLQPSLPEAYQVPNGMTAEQYLRKMVYEGAAVRYAGKMTPQHFTQIDHELDMIGSMGFAGFFLTVVDIVNFARREGILCQGRGSAANSAVCYCLYITAVDPIGMTLLFERFLSGDRVEYPDIDIDFAHRERERVLQYVYNKYGRAHAAMVCEHITWRGRSAVRDAARVLGFSTEQSDILATFSDRFSAKSTADTLRIGEEKDEVILNKRYETARESGERHWQDRYALDSHKSSHTERRDPTTSIRPVTSGRELFRQAGFDPDDIRVRLLADVVAGLHGLPRHRSIHVGGFILTAQPLGEVVPIEPASMADRTVIQWEKDDLDGAKLVKIDLLGLGMLTVLQDCLAYIRRTRGLAIDLGQLEMTNQAVYDTMCAADTVGVFQIESRAQMSTLPRLKPR
ncbi:MAG: DNA polymerase III subunit alpha, partial [Gemmatimonas sp.]